MLHPYNNRLVLSLPDLEASLIYILYISQLYPLLLNNLSQRFEPLPNAYRVLRSISFGVKGVLVNSVVVMPLLEVIDLVLANNRDISNKGGAVFRCLICPLLQDEVSSATQVVRLNRQVLAIKHIHIVTHSSFFSIRELLAVVGAF